MTIPSFGVSPPILGPAEGALHIPFANRTVRRRGEGGALGAQWRVKGRSGSGMTWRTIDGIWNEYKEICVPRAMRLYTDDAATENLPCLTWTTG